jgi:hypothetical protein
MYFLTTRTLIIGCAITFSSARTTIASRSAEASGRTLRKTTVRRRTLPFGRNPTFI